MTYLTESVLGFSFGTIVEDDETFAPGINRNGERIYASEASSDCSSSSADVARIWYALECCQISIQTYI